MSMWGKAQKKKNKHRTADSETGGRKIEEQDTSK